mgnify:CR=1 FL=1
MDERPKSREETPKVGSDDDGWTNAIASKSMSLFAASHNATIRCMVLFQ